MGLDTAIKQATRGDPDAYVTADSAMYVYGMFKGRPAQVQVATRRRSREVYLDVGLTFRLIHLPQSLLGGYTTAMDTAGEAYSVATPEKALFDRIFDAYRPWHHLNFRFTVPNNFSLKSFEEWVDRVPEPVRRKWIEREGAKLLRSNMIARSVLAPARAGLPDVAEALEGLASAVDQSGYVTLAVASLALGLAPTDARRAMAKLVRGEAAIALTRDTWAIGPLDLYAIGPKVVRGGAYITGRAALVFHGLAREQGDPVEVASTDPKGSRCSTKVGDFRALPIPRALLGGFETWRGAGGVPVLVATPEKAIIDLEVERLEAYGSGPTGRLPWSGPSRLRKSYARPWIERIADSRDREVVKRAFEAVVKRAALVRAIRDLPPRRPTLVESSNALPRSIALELLPILYERLVETAKVGAIVAFADLLATLHTWDERRPTRRQLDAMLGAIGRSEVEAGRPILPSVVAIGSGGLPSQSFFALARDMGWPGAAEDEGTFVEDERESSWTFWSDDQRPAPMTRDTRPYQDRGAVHHDIGG